MKIKFIVSGIAIAYSSLVHTQNISQPNTAELQKYYEAVQNSFSYSNLPSMPTFERKAGTVGSAYLFENWVTGYVIDNEGAKFAEGYLFNYNKVNQNIYIRVKDVPGAFLVSRDMLKSIFLSDGTISFAFDKVASLDSNQFYNTITKGSKYSLYSFTHTKFIPSDFHTNGVSSSGNMYDEFKDEVVYYIVFADGTSKELPFKKKAVKSFFEKDKEKVNEFFKNFDTAANPFGEIFVKMLVEYLNT